MSLLLELDEESGAHVRGETPGQQARVPPKPANEGHGDVRKRIVPVVKPPAGPSATTWENGRYLALTEWLEAPEQGGAILLQPADDPRALEGCIDTVALIAVDFHRIGDGRGLSHAVWLRKRLGYRGPLRALGAVTADQVYALARVGFDQFALRDDQDGATALQALKTFSMPYQGVLVAGARADREAAHFEARIALLERALRDIAASTERPVLASSLSAEDMAITDVIARLKLPIDIVTLDTGRLHAETLALIEETKAHYGLEIAIFRPDPEAIELYVKAFDVDGFYDGVEERKLCCRIRKVEPLYRALQGRSAWITGQRREQGLTRAALKEVEHDGEREMAKYNPLADWSWADVLAYAARFNVPMSALYARGYVSIGCEPCTKAVRPGEDPRNGRWWWENQESKECGLHTNLTTTR